MIDSRLLRVFGHVQGVGFRHALRREARRLGLTGWVRNRSDGTVEALVQGPGSAIDALEAWARHGPPGARVVELRTAPAGENERVHLQFVQLETL